MFLELALALGTLYVLIVLGENVVELLVRKQAGQTGTETVKVERYLSSHPLKLQSRCRLTDSLVTD